MPSYYPPTSFHFRVSIPVGSNKFDTSFQEVGGLSAEIATEDLAEGGVNTQTHRLPGRAKYGNLVLKRGILTNSALIQWFKDAIESYSFAPADISVYLLNKDDTAIITWEFIQAWPVKWVIGDLKATDNAVAVETIELAYHRFVRTVAAVEPDTIDNMKQSNADIAKNAAIGLAKRTAISLL